MAKRYYAGGRVMNAVVLYETFQTAATGAELQESISSDRRSSDAGCKAVLAMVRGG
ncbi:MAG: hypothetical protein IPI73_30755 [Betaproteobacteria bacterium]|nr:hypothetical protein [Betaproteobacteria bacterium]